MAASTPGSDEPVQELEAWKSRSDGKGQVRDSGCREKVFTARRGPRQDVADETTLPEIDEGKIHIQAFLPSRTWNLERIKDGTQTYLRHYVHTIKVRWGFRAAFACAHCNAVF